MGTNHTFGTGRSGPLFSRRQRLALAVALTMMLSSIAVVATAGRQASPAPLKARALYAAHDPIYVAGDLDWDAYGFPGLGSESDPYVISGYDIAGIGADAIHIQDTSAYYVVQDCYAHGDGYGVFLSNAPNGTLVDVNCSENANDGLYATTSMGDLVIGLDNVTAMYNGGYGIDLYAYPGDLQALLTDCNASWNGYGVYLEGNNYLNFSMVGCNVSFNNADGIDAWSDSWDMNAALEACSITDNNGDGLYFDASNTLFLSMVGVDVFRSAYYGAELYSDYWDINVHLEDCNVSESWSDGLWIESANALNITMDGVDISWNYGYGIEAYTDYGDLRAYVDGCNASYNGYSGLYFYGQNELRLDMQYTVSSWNYQAWGWSAGLEAISGDSSLVANLTSCNMSYNANEGISLSSGYDANLTITDCALTWNDQVEGYSAGIEAYVGGSMNLTMERSVISDHLGPGLYAEANDRFLLNMNSSSVLRNGDEGNGYGYGVEVYTYNGDAVLDLDHCSISGNYWDGLCIDAYADVVADIEDSVMTENVGFGIDLYSENGAVFADLLRVNSSYNYMDGIYLQSFYGLSLAMTDCSSSLNGRDDYGGYGVETYSGNDNVAAVLNRCNVSGNYNAGIYQYAWLDASLDADDSSFTNSFQGYGIESSSTLGSVYADLARCNMSDNCWSGVYLSSGYTAFLAMADCDASRNGVYSGYGYGVEAYSSDHTEAAIDRCRVDGNYDDGLYISNAGYSRVANSSFSYNTGMGVDIGGFYDGSIVDNVCSFNGQQGIAVSYGTGSDISHNILSDNSAEGLALWYSSGCAASWNLMSRNVGYGAALYSSTGCTVWNNTFMFNRGSTTVYDPGLVQGFDDSGNAWNVDGTPHGWGNFWMDWTTPDDNGDGIVDVPYALDGSPTMDNYPLTEPRYGFAKVVSGMIRDAGGRPIEGVGVVVVLLDGATVVATGVAETDAEGTYEVTFEWLEWDVGYTIEVTANYGGNEEANTTVADSTPAQEVNITYGFEIPQFGSFAGLLLAILLVGAVGALFLVRGRVKARRNTR